MEGRQSHRLPEEGVLRVEIKKQTHDDTWKSVEGRQAHRLPEEGVFRVEIKKHMMIPGRVWKGGRRTDFLRKEFSGWKLKTKHADTWQSVEGRQAHRLPEEGVLRVVEAEGLVNDVGLRLHPKTQQGHGFAVLRHELDLANAKKKTSMCAVSVV